MFWLTFAGTLFLFSSILAAGGLAAMAVELVTHLPYSRKHDGA
jgi:hypothetical protein